MTARAQDPDLLLTNAAQIRQLPPASAAAGLPARVTGVVTYYDPDHHLAFVQDATAGTYVDPTWHIIDPVGFSDPIQAGHIVELTGLTRAGRFAPFLSHNPEARVLGRADRFPEPLRPLRRLLLDPTFHSQWVELEAFVRTAKIDAGRLLLQLALGARDFNAYVVGDWKGNVPPTGLSRSDVRIRGVYGSIFNDRRQLVGLRLFVPSLEQVTILDAGVANAFAQPPRAIGEIMQFNPNPGERIHLRGTVLAHHPKSGFYLRGQDGALWVEAPRSEPLNPGQEIDVVGFPRAGSLRPVLLDAIVKTGETGPPPRPRDLELDEMPPDSLDGDLVRLEARLLDTLVRPDNTLLLLQSERATFQARLPGDSDATRTLSPDSWLQLTGICLIQGEARIEEDNDDNLRKVTSRPESFSLLLRSSDDIRVLATPPWWTPQRVRSILLGIAALTGAAFLWGALLRRKVLQQTELIANQLEREHVAEERARIARELHDTLEQQLVGIKLQLDTVASRLEQAPDRARRSLELARAMLRRSQSDARQSVWDLRSADLSRTRLDVALRETIEPLRHDAGPEIQVDTTGSFPSPLDGVAKNHLLRIAQESVTNALKHAAPSRIEVSLESFQGGIVLRIRDDGRGFDPETVQGAHFGLLGLRERAGKLNADLRVDSRPDQGTVITLRLPFTA